MLNFACQKRESGFQQLIWVVLDITIFKKCFNLGGACVLEHINPLVSCRLSQALTAEAHNCPFCSSSLVYAALIVANRSSNSFPMSRRSGNFSEWSSKPPQCSTHPPRTTLGYKMYWCWPQNPLHCDGARGLRLHLWISSWCNHARSRAQISTLFVAWKIHCATAGIWWRCPLNSHTNPTSDAMPSKSGMKNPWPRSYLTPFSICHSCHGPWSGLIGFVIQWQMEGHRFPTPEANCALQFCFQIKFVLCSKSGLFFSFFLHNLLPNVHLFCTSFWNLPTSTFHLFLP